MAGGGASGFTSAISTGQMRKQATEGSPVAPSGRAYLAMRRASAMLLAVS